jgi:hypothetical protein
VTGIRESRNGGVINPMRKLGGRVCAGSVSVTAECAECGELWGVSGGATELSSLVAMSRIAARRGRSLED